MRFIIIKVLNLLRFGTVNPSLKQVGFFYSKKISLKTNSLFIHIPKSAGISFCYGLYGKDSFGHVSIKSYKKNINKKKFDNLFKFTIVRNPYDRLKSAYIYLSNGGRKAKIDLEYQCLISEYKDFEDFVLNFFTTDSYLRIEHFIPQTNWLIDENNKIIVDYIGYFEDIENEFQIISKKIFSKNSNKTLPKKNVTKNEFKDIKYTKKMIEIVNSVYKQDFLFLNYDKL